MTKVFSPAKRISFFAIPQLQNDQQIMRQPRPRSPRRTATRPFMFGEVVRPFHWNERTRLLSRRVKIVHDAGGVLQPTITKRPQKQPTETVQPVN